MASITYLDTHILVWLYAQGKNLKLPAASRDAIQASEDLRISPMVQLELTYLQEIGRATAGAQEIISAMSSGLNLRICPVSFAQVVLLAQQQPWTRDPFDRLIVAQAQLTNAALITKDETIRNHYALALWD